MKKLARVSFGALLLTGAMSVAAYPIDITSIGGTFENTIDSAGNSVSGDGGNSISWGYEGIFGQFLQSGYTFSGASQVHVPDNSAFKLGILTHTNESTLDFPWAGDKSATLTSADLVISLTFNDGDAFGSGEFTFSHDETRDNYCKGFFCLGGFVGNVDDTIHQTASSTTSSSFTLNGFEYSLELIGLENIGSTPEGFSNDYELLAKLHAISVPEPGTLALLGLGLAGLGLARRRKA